MTRGAGWRIAVSISTVLLLTGGLSALASPAAAGPGVGGPIEDDCPDGNDTCGIPSPIPSVTTSGWIFEGVPKGECQGEWAKTIHEETRRHTVSILGYEVGSYEYEHTETRIKYEVTCGIVYELKVKGSGSVEREVGIEYRYEGQNSINGVSRPVSRERTDPRRCTYFLGGCSFDLEKSFGKAYVDSRQNVKKKPVTVTEICVDGSKLPKGIVAYNRPKWFGDPPGTIPGVEDESKVHSSPEDPCVEDIPIDWDKVPSSDLSIEGLAVSR